MRSLPPIFPNSKTSTLFNSLLLDIIYEVGSCFKGYAFSLYPAFEIWVFYKLSSYQKPTLIETLL